MMRGCVFAGLALAVLALCGCSNAVQRLDFGEWHKYMPQEPSLGDDVSRSLKPSASAPRAPVVARDLINRAQREEAVASRSEFWPWARVDTRDIEQVGGDDQVVERALKEPKQGNCRSC